jgi:hypothetical protein
MIWLWHRRLGHPSFSLLQHNFPSLFSLNNVSQFQCDTCELAKHYWVSFPANYNKSSLPFAIVHSNVCSASRVVSLSVFHWLVTFIGHYSHTTRVYLLKNNSDLSSCFQTFMNLLVPNLITPLKLFVLTTNGKWRKLPCRTKHMTTCQLSHYWTP